MPARVSKHESWWTLGGCSQHPCVEEQVSAKSSVAEEEWVSAVCGERCGEGQSVCGARVWRARGGGGRQDRASKGFKA